MLRNLLTLITTIGIAHAAAAVSLQVNPGNPLLLENRRQVTLLQINLEGAERKSESADRLPVNLSVVLDRSGSMSGDRIEQAKEAARTVVNLLGPNDIISLVTYSDEAETIVPSTKLTDRRSVLRAIDEIYSSGNTALFSGVSKGLAEVRKFKSKNYVNRVILLSDGMANVGPSSPSELASLGRSSGREGIAVTTIGLGLGYNEDLMSQLALASEGNHAFVENSMDLANIFQRELGGVLSVVAQGIDIQIHCPSGVRPIRILDQDAQIRGSKVSLNFNQIYSRQNKVLLLEVEVDPRKKGVELELAQVSVRYDDPTLGSSQTLNGSARVRFTEDQERVRREVYKPAVVEAAKAKSNIASKKALDLRDKGDFIGAGAVMMQNVQEMRLQATEYDLPELKKESQEVEQEAKVLSAPAPAQELNRSRKDIKAKQIERSSKWSIQK